MENSVGKTFIFSIYWILWSKSPSGEKWDLTKICNLTWWNFCFEVATFFKKIWIWPKFLGWFRRSNFSWFKIWTQKSLNWTRFRIKIRYLLHRSNELPHVFLLSFLKFLKRLPFSFFLRKIFFPAGIWHIF